MVFPLTVKSGNAPHHWLVAIVVLVLHTTAVYVCAIHYFPWLVSCWFAWIAPALHIYSVISPVTWLSQHLAAVSIIPGLILGYIVVRSDDSPAAWAWVVPTLVLSLKMLLYRGPSSVLYGSSMSAFSYFFDIQTVPGAALDDLRATDPVRILQQLMTTAPFYTGAAYSLGALLAKRRLMHSLFRPRSAEQHDAGGLESQNQEPDA